MKHEILSEKQNDLLRRKELHVAVEHANEPTPSKAALQGLMAKQFGVDAARIDVNSVYSDKGRARALSKIFIWEEPPKRKAKEKKEREEKAEAVKVGESKTEEK